jgi:hypothetical protein
MDDITKIKELAGVVTAAIEEMSDLFRKLTDDDKAAIGWGDFNGEGICRDLLNAIPHRISENGVLFEKKNCCWAGSDASVQDVLEQIQRMGVEND